MHSLRKYHILHSVLLMKLYIKDKNSTKYAMEHKGKFIVILIQFNQAGKSLTKTYKIKAKIT